MSFSICTSSQSGGHAAYKRAQYCYSTRAGLSNDFFPHFCVATILFHVVVRHLVADEAVPRPTPSKDATVRSSDEGLAKLRVGGSKLDKTSATHIPALFSWCCLTSTSIPRRSCWPASIAMSTQAVSRTDKSSSLSNVQWWQSKRAHFIRPDRLIIQDDTWRPRGTTDILGLVCDGRWVQNLLWVFNAACTLTFRPSLWTVACGASFAELLRGNKAISTFGTFYKHSQVQGVAHLDPDTSSPSKRYLAAALLDMWALCWIDIAWCPITTI